MENPLIFNLLEEISLQCRAAKYAYSEIPAQVTANDPEKALFYAEGFLHAAMNVSRLLWPDAESAAERGAKLREILRTPDDATLPMAEIRRHQAQRDERLVDFLSAADTRDPLPLNLMPVGTLEGFPEDRFRRNLDPETMQFTFEGIRCPLRQFQKELQKIEQMAETWMRLNNPW